MRIKVKTLRTLVFTGILAVGAIFAGGLITKKVSNHVAYGETEKEYCCGDLVFGNEYFASANISTGDPLEDCSSICTPSHGLSTNNFELSWTAVYYKADATKNYPLRMGSGSVPGTITINLLNNLYCDKVLVYACGYTGDASPMLKVNTTDYQNIATSSGSSYVFNDAEGNEKPYVFSGFTGSNTIEISTKVKKQRVMVSKIVLRLYENK